MRTSSARPSTGAGAIPSASVSMALGSGDPGSRSPAIWRVSPGRHAQTPAEGCSAADCGLGNMLPKTEACHPGREPNGKRQGRKASKVTTDRMRIAACEGSGHQPRPGRRVVRSGAGLSGRSGTLVGAGRVAEVLEGRDDLVGLVGQGADRRGCRRQPGSPGRRRRGDWSGSSRRGRCGPRRA